MSLSVWARLKALLDDQQAGVRFSAMVVLAAIFSTWVIVSYALAQRVIAGDPIVLDPDTLGFVGPLALSVPVFFKVYNFLRSDRARR